MASPVAYRGVFGHCAAFGIAAGLIDGATVFRKITRPANHDRFTGLASGHFADCGGHDLVADV